LTPLVTILGMKDLPCFARDWRYESIVGKRGQTSIRMRRFWRPRITATSAAGRSEQGAGSETIPATEAASTSYARGVDGLSVPLIKRFIASEG